MWIPINYPKKDIKAGDIINSEGHVFRPREFFDSPAPESSDTALIVIENKSTKDKFHLFVQHTNDKSYIFDVYDEILTYYIWQPDGVPDNYKPLDACKNCKYVFIRRERKAPTEYYCCIDKSERPLCGSIFMNESEINSGFSWDKWEEWKVKHIIKDEFGKCNFYTKGTE